MTRHHHLFGAVESSRFTATPNRRCIRCHVVSLDFEATPTVWVAGWNMPGYLPESEPVTFASWDGAASYLRDELERVAEWDLDEPQSEIAIAASWAIGELDRAAYGETWDAAVGDCAYWIGVDSTASEYVARMVENYAEAALWSSTATDGEDGDTYNLDDRFDIDDIEAETFAEMVADCLAFYVENADDLSGIDAEQAGHDFWLTRNRHGVGFWDRGLGDVGDRLTKAAHAYGWVDLWPVADGMVAS